MLKERGIERAGAGGVPGDALGRVRRERRAGHPVRATISDMGPLLLARMLDLNETQEACCSSSSRSPTTTACCCST